MFPAGRGFSAVFVGALCMIRGWLFYVPVFYGGKGRKKFLILNS
jgi:hypothetical protein